MTDPFDIVVVGGGLIGAAATRYLAEAGRRVAVVAAPEPSDWSASRGPFASHYDAGRITRVIASDPIWSELAARSMARYGLIEANAGIRFHDPRGLAWLGVDVAAAVADANERGADARLVSPDWLFAMTGIRAPTVAGLEIALEGPPAGVVNPRALMQAQLLLADRAGATVIRSAASQVVPGGSTHVVSGSFGEVRAERLLLATGAYGARLIGIELALQRLLRTTVRIELGPAPEMPSLILEPTPHPDVDDLYWNPPVRYPDGRSRFKVGCETVHAPTATSEAEITDWFQSQGDPADATALTELSRAMLPTRRFESIETAPCVITRSATGYPYVGFLEDRVAVALAGNGSSAKSSDEIGRLAALLFDDDRPVDDLLDSGAFDPVVA